MRTFLKVAAVLMLSFGGFCLLIGLSSVMGSAQTGDMAQSLDVTIDPELASLATMQIGLMLLCCGALDGLVGLFAVLSEKRRKLLIVSILFVVLLFLVYLPTYFFIPFFFIFLFYFSIFHKLHCSNLAYLYILKKHKIC